MGVVRRSMHCGLGMLIVLKHFVTLLIATVLGSIAYIFALRLIWKQDIGGEYASVVFAALTSLLVAYPLAYLPILKLLKRRLHGTKPYAVFPFCGILLGVIPVAIINLRWNFGLRAMLSPESQLFYIYFLVVGSVIGGLYPLIWPDVAPGPRKNATNNPMDRSGGSAAS
jgi:hypothetical protein